jgi:hypothetical protein
MKCEYVTKDMPQVTIADFTKKARANIVEEYDKWRKSSEISWKEYLSEIAKNPLTGKWAKQAAQHLLKRVELKNVKNG